MDSGISVWRPARLLSQPESWQVCARVATATPLLLPSRATIDLGPCSPVVFSEYLTQLPRLSLSRDTL